MSRKSRITVTAASFLLTAALVSFSFAQTAGGKLCKSASGCGCTATNPAPMRDITTMQLVKDMGLGINLGNTFEAACDWDDANCWMADYDTPELAWQSVPITRDIIKGYKAAGFNTVRVPVAWSHRMTGNALAAGQTNGTYTIRPAVMDRVQEVVDWILEEEMYVILNIHWDGGWWDKFPSDSAECMRKYQRIWTQVGERFKDYDDRLLFASLNEEGGWDDVWYIWRNGSDLTAKARAYGILNAINQAFVDLIRSQGGNNAGRHLQVQGYQTNIDRTADEMFKMPTDVSNRLAVSVHYYDPFAFTHISEPVDWGGIINPMTTWGTDADYKELNDFMDKMKVGFIDKGIPVIMGEYGVASWDATFLRERESVRKYTLAVTKAMLDRNMLPVLWDVQLDAGKGEHIYYYDRHSASFPDAEMAAGFRKLADEGSASIGERTVSARPALSRPSITVKGRTLNISTSSSADLHVRMIDIKGRVRATFSISGGSGTYSTGKVPAGRYFIDIGGAGVSKTTAAVILK
ncbi:MAG: glycoside hydrolase family 5 protein [Chitinispirillia bacterium]|nr:glycoside hydrolase family 5 protein [Chitinispirillia bacterium]